MAIDAPPVCPPPATEPASAVSKVDRIIASLSDRIRSKEWPQEQALPSRTRLSEEYGVSPATVSIAIRQLQKEGMVHIVSGKGVFISDGASRAGNGKVYPIVGIRRSFFSCSQSLASMSNQDLFGLLNIGGIFEAASSSQCPVLLLPGDHQEDRISRVYCESLGVQGVIFFVWDRESMAEALSLRKSGFPVILANKPVESTPLNFIDYDARGLIRQVVQDLTALGHRKIGVICAETAVQGYYEQLKRVFIEALEEAGIYDSFHDYWRFIPRHDGHLQPFHEAEAATDALLDLAEPPTAVFCWVPPILDHVQTVLKRRHLQTPKDISLLCSGYHGEQEMTVSGFMMPHHERGKRLLVELYETIRNPFHCVQELIPCRFVDKGTVSGPAK